MPVKINILHDGMGIEFISSGLVTGKEIIEAKPHSERSCAHFCWQSRTTGIHCTQCSEPQCGTAGAGRLYHYSNIHLPVRTCGTRQSTRINRDRSERRSFSGPLVNRDQHERSPTPDRDDHGSPARRQCGYLFHLPKAQLCQPAGGLLWYSL